MSHEYQEFGPYYSPLKDCLVTRLSMADSKGGEFFVEVEGQGKAYREAKVQALDDLMQAIALGLEPGKVVRR